MIRSYKNAMPKERYEEITTLYELLANEAVQNQQPFYPTMLIGRNNITEEELIAYRVICNRKHRESKKG